MQQPAGRAVGTSRSRPHRSSAPPLAESAARALIRTPFVRRLKHLEPRAQFVRQVLRVRNQWPPKALRTFDGTKDKTLIRSLSTSYSLMSVYTEGERPDECYVGRPRHVTAEALTLDEVDPMGRWLLKPATYRFAKVTRLDVGGRYEEALRIHAGDHRL